MRGKLPQLYRAIGLGITVASIEQRSREDVTISVGVAVAHDPSPHATFSAACARLGLHGLMT